METITNYPLKLSVELLKRTIMKTFGERNFELMMKFALSSDEMLMVRGGNDGGEEGGGDPEDSDPEKPPIIIKI